MDAVIDSSRRLAEDVDKMSFSTPAHFVYNPLTYAFAPHANYISKWAKPGVKALWLGMNPGPWGMMQTGVPFGDVELVRDWLGVSGEVQQPAAQHPKRKIEGFNLTRGEVSGRRLWGMAKDRFGTPENFFSHYYVTNYCPLAFLSETGSNVTPDKLKKGERDALIARCDEALREVVRAMEVDCIVGVGVWATKRAEKAAGDMVNRVVTLLHPSPASPAANRGWAEQACKQLEAAGLPSEA